VSDSDDNDVDLPAGEFSSWMVQIDGAVRGEHGSDVPCDGCTACCTSSQFVLIGPDETETLSHIPAELLFPAPRLPRGNMLLGYDERGHCPMLIDDRCSIYEHRPLTCRTYDCRVFPAAGLEPDDDKVLIARRARRWRFTFATQAERDQRDAIRAAALFLANHPDLLPSGSLTNTTQLAVQAIEVHAAFLQRDVDPDADLIRVELRRRER
jgi:Fe-S-cluster containining protein